MQITKDKLYYFFLLTVFSAASFLIGLIIFYALPCDSSIFAGLNTALTERLTSDLISFDAVVANAWQELKYFAFLLMFLFSEHRIKFTIALVSVRGAAFGICSAMIMRSVKYEYLDVNYSFLSCFVYILLITALTVLFCYAGAHAIAFSAKLFYPIKIRSVTKRKDTRLFLIDFLAICGGAVLISALILTNFYIMLF